MLKNFYLMVLMSCSFFVCASDKNVEKIDIAIIGGGCSGLGAALVTSEYQYSTYVFTGPSSGGSLNVKTIVGNWPGIETTYGNNIMETFYNQVKQRKAHIEEGTITHFDFSKKPFQLTASSGKKYLASAVLIATGTLERDLNTPGYNQYKEKGIWTNDYLFAHFPQFLDSVKGKEVIVVGGGEDAMKKSVYASRSGAKKVYIIVRSDKMKISEMRKLLLSKYSNIEVLYNSSVISFLGNNTELTQVKVQTPDGEKTILTQDAIISIGREANSHLFQGKVKIDRKGFIELKCNTQQTSVPGVFAAGDVTTNFDFGQGAIAASDGMKAGYEILDYLVKTKKTEKKKTLVLEK